MSERFEVPADDVLHTVGGRMVRLADVERLVRAEVERALDKMVRQDGRTPDFLRGVASAIVRDRFPSPDMVEVRCGKGHLLATVPVSDCGWAIRDCPECGGEWGELRRVPPITPDTEPRCAA